MAAMEYLGAWGTLIHEKNLKPKISCQTPFNPFQKKGISSELFKTFTDHENHLKEMNYFLKILNLYTLMVNIQILRDYGSPDKIQTFGQK
jgi:hypothetical protein